MKSLFRAICLALMLVPAAGGGPAAAQELVKVKAARLAFPSMSSLMLDVVKERGFDKRHGIELELVSNSAVAVFYASIANGEAESFPGGRMYSKR